MFAQFRAFVPQICLTLFDVSKFSDEYQSRNVVAGNHAVAQKAVKFILGILHKFTRKITKHRFNFLMCWKLHFLASFKNQTKLTYRLKLNLNKKSVSIIYLRTCTLNLHKYCSWRLHTFLIYFNKHRQQYCAVPHSLLSL